MKNLLKTGLVVFAISVFVPLTAGSAAAQDSMKLDPLEPAVQAAIPDETPDGENFDGQGPLERVGEGEVVIGDLLWKLSPIAAYYKSNGFSALSSEFAPGAFVGYYVGANREITSLWLIEPAPR